MSLVLTYRQQLMQISPILVKEFESILTQFTKLFSVEHNPDGTHASVLGGLPVTMGVCLTPAFAASDFHAPFGSTMAWTVRSSDVVQMRYTLFGKVMLVSFFLQNTNVTAPVTTALCVRIPGGYSAKSKWQGSLVYRDAGGAYTDGSCEVDATSVNTKRAIFLYRAAFGNWTATAANDTLVNGSIVFEVE